MKRTIVLLSLLAVICGVLAVSLADNNLCHSDWAGYCQTQRQWEAGHCYANNPASTCDAIYADLVSSNSGSSANTSSGGSAEILGAANASQQGESRRLNAMPQPESSQAQQSSGQSGQSPAQLTPAPSSTYASDGTLPDPPPDTTPSGDPEITPTPDSNASTIAPPVITDEPSG